MMKNTRKVIVFPTVADPSVEDVLTEFLKDQQRRLRTRTYHRYEEVIDLLRHCLNGYGYHDLDNSSEVALYEKLYFQKNLEFCFIFGPDKILPSLGNFLNYFMIRKVMASEALLQATGTVVKKLIKWLEDRGYVDREQALRSTRIASEAARELPAAERLARLLYEYAQHHAPRYWTSELDDYFTIEKVSAGVLLLSGAGSSGLVEVRVPKEITDHCRVGWQVNLLLGKTRNGWCILETGNVYPS
ncbi:hypothetical protein [Syntrophobacter fumaroxidans]|uniref:Uncharacterized protein n=1 Tax=Syntrophobacter fumaroxidans (strain DSM 10017 / MPOB) TaxID=335543 RepID=A0LJ54_SYNFM|nr:hypothetical protein [Syntrophobacter fumaroxidans]ABK17456.1 conserved hypothetical protein [Syntrophobacter fumaroxidans MPOB]HOI93800.1 hypothetical protein [Syntrophobacter fumaroxidans]